MCLRLASAYMSGYELYPLIFMWSEEVTMGLLELFLLAIGLSMDAFAVSVCKGLAMQKVNFRSAAIDSVPRRARSKTAHATARIRQIPTTIRKIFILDHFLYSI